MKQKYLEIDQITKEMELQQKKSGVKNNQRNCSKKNLTWGERRWDPAVPSPATAYRCHAVRLLSTPCSNSPTSKGCQQGWKVQSRGRASTQPHRLSHPLWTSFRCWGKSIPRVARQGRDVDGHQSAPSPTPVMHAAFEYSEIWREL
jgi:hypothetical protein